MFDIVWGSEKHDLTNWHIWTIQSNDGGTSFTIQNHNGRYLYAADELNYDKNRRRVFTCHKNKLNQTYWQITPVENAQFFTLRNIKHHEYLYSDSTYRDRPVSNKLGYQVFTWGGEVKGVMIKESHWKITAYQF